MGKQRTSRKRRRRLQKKDVPIVTLATITIILLFVWGGLYWNESSAKAFIANANMKEQSQPALQKEEVAPTTNSQGLNAQVNKQPSAIGETIDSTGKSNDEPGVNGKVEVPPATKASESTEGTATKSDGQSPTKSEIQSSTKLDTQSPTKPDTQSSTKSDTQSPSKRESPSTNQVAPAVTQVTKVQKYEQQIIKVQDKCTKDMNVVLNGAEKSIQQLDKNNPVNVQVWREKLTTELVAAESTCEVAFQEQIHKAENDSVSAKVIEKWTTTYNALKVRLKEESQARLQRLMGM